MRFPASNAPRILGVATALPEQVVDAELALRTLTRLYPDEDESRMRAMQRRSGVECRHIVPSMEEVAADTDFAARNGRWREEALELAVRAAKGALRDADVPPDAIDVVIDVSCTGLCIPALDVPLAGRLGLRADVQRVPISLSGCAAGALATGLASKLAAGGARVLVVSAELCSLTRIPGDSSRTSLVASLIFGDGAAAMVVAPHGQGTEVRAVATRLVPGSEHVMGFLYGADGMRLVLEPELPDLLAEVLPEAIEGFLADHGRALGDVRRHLVHPGGRKILDAYERAFDLGPDGLSHSRDALRRHGNLSSATILSVLASARAADEIEDETLLIAIGPGMTLEFALLAPGAP